MAIFAALGVVAAWPARAAAQAQATASRRSDLAVFAEFQSLHPDYGGQVNKGIIAGLDYSFFLHGPLVPSLELRANYASVQVDSGEQVVLGGLRLDLPLRPLPPRLKPYVNFLVGAGQIDFFHAVQTSHGLYSRDNSVVYDYGGGLGYYLTHGFEIQAEFQHQNWNLGGGPSPLTLTPASIDAGLRYHVPIPSRRRR